jgi:hypothetical protein
MKKTMAVIGAGAALAGLLGTGAAAQTYDAVPVVKPLTLKLGAFLPINGTLKNAVGKTWFTAGAEYAFSKLGDQQNLMPLAYVDYAGANKHGLTVDYVGVGPGARYYLTAPGAGTTTPYVGGGVGAYFLHASGNGSSINNTKFGFKVNAGIEFQQMYLVEVNYTNAGSESGTRFDGVGIQVGARF